MAYPPPIPQPRRGGGGGGGPPPLPGRHPNAFRPPPPTSAPLPDPPLPERPRPVDIHRSPHPVVTSPTPSSSFQPPSAPAVSQGDRFGARLQSSYEAISKRHEQELKALESLRNHIYKRSRADKDYAETLLKINQTSRKAADLANNPSRIVQVNTNIIFASAVAHQITARVCVH